MDDIYLQIKELVIGLLVPARTEKRIDAHVFEEFHKILIDLEQELKGKEYIPRKIAGQLFFIYTSLAAEAEHCNYDDDLFLAVGEIADMLDRIFWESPFKN